MIPKTIHQIWLGNKSMPQKFKLYIDGWRNMYSDYEHILWNDSLVIEKNVIPEELKDLYFNNKLSCVFRADILRYLLIKKYGGIYLDVDFECLKRIPDQFLTFDFLGGIQNNGEIAIGFFAAKSEETILIDTINNILPNVELSKKRGMFCDSQLNEIIGPVFFTKICKKYLANKNYFFFSHQYFYPYWFNETHRQSENFKETSPLAYGVHHWAKSWG